MNPVWTYLGTLGIGGVITSVVSAVLRRDADRATIRNVDADTAAKLLGASDSLTDHLIARLDQMEKDRETDRIVLDQMREDRREDRDRILHLESWVYTLQNQVIKLGHSPLPPPIADPTQS